MTELRREGPRRLKGWSKLAVPTMERGKKKRCRGERKKGGEKERKKKEREREKRKLFEFVWVFKTRIFTFFEFSD